MLINSLLIPKESLVIATTNTTIEEALHLMENNNLRCIPVLDNNQTLFKGNIYKYHIYKYQLQGGQMDTTLVPLLKNATKFIHTTDSFFSLFFKLRDLPYISVLDDNQYFVGVVYHNDMLTMLSQNWNLSQSSYSLCIEMPETTKSLLQVIKLIKKYTNISNMITLERDDYYLRKRIIVTLPQQLSLIDYDKLKLSLKKHNYRIIEIENLTNGI